MSDESDIIARLRLQLENGLAGAQIEVAGGAGRYQIAAVAAAFVGLSAVKRQQAVYRCIDDLIRDGTVHAVTIQARTPDEADAART